MNPTPFSDFLKQSKCILGEGAVIERLRRNPGCELDAHIVNSGFIYHAEQRAALAAICRQYMVNCTHASIFRAALRHPLNSSHIVRDRIIGLLANTAALDPEELDDSAALVEEEPEVFGRSVADLHREFGMKILGGCCGTDDRHIHCLAKRLAGRQL